MKRDWASVRSGIFGGGASEDMFVSVVMVGQLCSV